MVPHLLEDPTLPVNKESKPKRKVIINIINSDQAENNATLENILKLSQDEDYDKVKKGMDGVIQPLVELSGMKLSNRYKRSSDSSDKESKLSNSDPLLDLKLAEDKSQSKRKVVINIINGGESNDAVENVGQELSGKEEITTLVNDTKIMDDHEDTSLQSVDETPEGPQVKKRKVVINIINGETKSESDVTEEKLINKQEEKKIDNIEEISSVILEKVNGSGRSSLDEYDSLYFSPPDGEFPVLQLNNFDYDYEYDQYEEDRVPEVSPVDPSQLLIGFGGSQSTTRIPFVRKPVRDQNLQNMGDHQVQTET